MTQGEGWKCPKCERVYGPMITECKECNHVIKEDLKKNESLLLD